MFTVDIDSDIQEAIREVGDFFRKDIPFVTARAINDTLFDVRRRIVGSTYPNAFTVRNVRFASLNWYVDTITTGGRNAGSFRAFKAGDIDRMEGGLMQRSFNTGGVREWTENQTLGGVKTARGLNIAIPAKPEQLRNKGGSIKKGMKPRNITKRKDTFMIKDKGGRKKYIAKRIKGTKQIDVVYRFQNRASIDARFKFYIDGFDTIDHVLLPHWGNNLARVVHRTRFD